MPFFPEKEIFPAEKHIQLKLLTIFPEFLNHININSYQILNYF